MVVSHEDEELGAHFHSEGEFEGVVSIKADNYYPRGGLKSRRKGDAFEVAVCKDLERLGWWTARLRQGGGQLVDVVAAKAVSWCGQDHICGMELRHIQCKANTPYMRPAERERFVMDAQNCGAVPVIAWRGPDKSIQYKVLSCDS